MAGLRETLPVTTRFSPRYRPPSFATLPRAGWTLIERPSAVRDYDGRTDLPVSRRPFGVVTFDRELTVNEVTSFELDEVYTI